MRENLRGLSPHGSFARREEVRNRLIGFNVQHFAVKRREGPFLRSNGHSEGSSLVGRTLQRRASSGVRQRGIALAVAHFAGKALRCGMVGDKIGRRVVFRDSSSVLPKGNRLEVFQFRQALVKFSVVTS